MEKSFFQALFDSSFTTFITRSVAKVFYITSIGTIGLLVMLGILIGAIVMNEDFVRGWLILLLSPPAGFVALIAIRLGFESAVALVLIAENTGKGKVTK
jgi:hypothetical protein